MTLHHDRIRPPSGPAPPLDPKSRRKGDQTSHLHIASGTGSVTVVLDVTHAHFWDTTAINALDKVVIKFRQEGAEVELVGLNAASKAIVERLAIYDKPGAADAAAGH